ncbi:hypothetical protein [Rhodospirillum sp. A1_3_36]|uniref:hypothetical protein n=1 Tax=Rhodospirillum sp. A1_3_36 TaxID=3391666 RepID=UPI0039A50A31
MSKEEDLYERWCEARLKETEAELKELRAEKALASARKAHLKAMEVTRAAYEAWDGARCQGADDAQ